MCRRDSVHDTVKQILTYFFLWRLNVCPVIDLGTLKMKMAVKSLD
jgi:hypothetical protein